MGWEWEFGTAVFERRCSDACVLAGWLARAGDAWAGRCDACYVCVLLCVRWTDEPLREGWRVSTDGLTD